MAGPAPPGQALSGSAPRAETAPGGVRPRQARIALALLSTVYAVNLLDGNAILGEWPELELVRLAVPRRVYTRSHLDYVADVCVRLLDERQGIAGLRLTYQAPMLRHFTARLEPATG